MRTAFIEALTELAAQDERVWLLCADLGYSVLERFAARFPERYINAGVAEQNMTGVAAGLAMSGKMVFTYSIANFPVMRCLEQVRNDVCYHNLNVKVVAVGGGFAYGSAGYSHHAIEDLGVMRLLPNMTVVAPGDPVETMLVTRALSSHCGPAYLRLGKGGEPKVHQQTPEFAIGKAIEIRAGCDVLLLTAGGVLPLVMEAAARLEREGVSAAVTSMPTVWPPDRAYLAEVVRRFPRVITVEEHGRGGLGTIIAEEFASHRAPPLRCVRTDGTVIHRAGPQARLREMAGISLDAIVGAATAVCPEEYGRPNS